MKMWKDIVVLLTVTSHLIPEVGGACTLTDVTSSLNSCVMAASGTSDTKWLFPYGSLAQQATFCTTSSQSALTTCIEAVVSTCLTDAKFLKIFSTSAQNLLTAYSNLCGNSLIADAQACMSVISNVATYTTAQTAFTTSVDALPSAASYIELCGLATTLKYTAYTTLLTPTCPTDHLTVWTTFYDDVINTNVCSFCSTNSQAAVSSQSAFVLITTVLLSMSTFV